MFAKWKINKLKKKLSGLAQSRQTNAVNDTELKKEIALYLELAQVLDKLRFCRKFPHAAQEAIEFYRAAADLDDVKAKFIVGQRLLELGKFWDTFVQSPFKTTAHELYAKMVFDDGLRYLRSAQNQRSAEAIRLLGLAHINGWGLPKDENAGFKLVVESIEIENAWDKATQIFQQIGLNKPEFFASIMSMRGQK